ncbi:2'-5' RNA ligase family protein [Actinomycetospora rhizophila]|uniref:2'-5' RNA ligase family protein n=1 Tax=Actinomycetospora rhizophila TaxID=1416876 RepID=A0ABV9ZEA5_9PSEU
MSAADGRSRLVALIGEADTVLGGHRWRLDPRAAVGLTAHVTVLAPFLPPATIDTTVVKRLDVALDGARAFDCVFDQTRWFERDCLWLAPVSEAPFRALTVRVCAEFPELAPYGGRRPVVPHVTVGFSRASSVDDLRIAAARLGATLPIRARVRRLDLLVLDGAKGRWRSRARFELAGDRAPGTVTDGPI